MIDQETKELIDKIKDEIKRNEIYKEYISLKKALLESDYLEDDVKKIVTSDYLSLSTEKRREYARIKMESMDKNPLLNNYFVAKEETENLIKEVRDLLDLWFMQF